jgi:hypothetical protein
MRTMRTHQQPKLESLRTVQGHFLAIGTGDIDDANFTQQRLLLPTTTT